MLSLAAAWETIKAFGIWQRLGSALAWITASASHLLTFALALSLMGNAWLYNSRQADRAAGAQILAKWQLAFGQQKRATGLLFGAIQSQNSAIEHWHLQGMAHREAAAKALRDAEQRDGIAKARADRLEARTATLSPSAPECRTAKELMDQRDEL